MKKIGIVTLYAGQNFGNKLQNYAVEQICLQNGFQPVTFKYEIASKPVVAKVGKLSKLKPSYISSYIKSVLSGRCHIKNSDTCVLKQFNFWRKNKTKIDGLFKARVSAYNVFDYKNLNYAQRTIELGEENALWTDDFAMFLSGSDQVWNPYYQSVNQATFLRFAPFEKRASIAGSFGVAQIPEERKKDFQTWLSEFRFLSVREERGAEIINELCSRQVPVIVDPTMIVDVNAWDKLSAKPRFNLPEKYILTYFLGDRTKKYGKFVKKMQKKYGLQVVNLLDIMQPQYLACDPAEFVYCIKNASIVCTDSFHATVFSILYKIPFVAFNRVEGKRSMGSRIQTLLKNFGLEERKFEKICKEQSVIESMSWAGIDQRLEELRGKAKSYLDQVFSVAKEMPIDLINQPFNVYQTDLCTGCGACVEGCPVNALKFETKNGFSYPTLNRELCIDCGKCAKVCPVYKVNAEKQENVAYAMRNKDEEIVKNSSSGGVISALAKRVLENGVVYGASFENDFSLKHVAITSLEDLPKIQKSKYLQSSIIDAYANIRQNLADGKQVLFIGTPCQVAGVHSIIGDVEGLYKVAIVCHGVPSPEYWMQYKTQLEKTHGSVLKSFDFRNKVNGWKNYAISYEFENGEKIIEKPSQNPFMQKFYHNKSLRASCGNCSFKAGKSGADITIGDFWGLQTLAKNLDDDKGTSVVVIHTEKGNKLINSLDNIEVLGEFNLFEAMGANPSYFYSSIINKG